MLRPGAESRWPLRNSNATLFTACRTRQSVRSKFPSRDESWTCSCHRNAAEAGLPEGGPEPHSFDGDRTSSRLAGILFLCDEYQSFATVGESDPTGDEKFFALSRRAKCIPTVATQSISSLRSTLPGESRRTLLQTFRTKIFLALGSDSPPQFTHPITFRDLTRKIAELRRPKVNLDRPAGASCGRAIYPNLSSIGRMPNVPYLAEILQNRLSLQSPTTDVAAKLPRKSMPSDYVVRTQPILVVKRF
jgi:hypothetical protein